MTFATRRSSLRVFLFLLLPYFIVLSLPLATPAQVATGTPPFGSFGGGPEAINLANLNAHLTIPVLHKSGRGQNFSFDLTYDSSVWNPVTSGSAKTWMPAPNFGWNGSLLYLGIIKSSATIQTGICGPFTHLQQTSTTTYHWSFQDGWGAVHPFPNTSSVITNPCTGNSTTGFNNSVAFDGSGYSLSANGSTVTLLTASNGSVINTNNGVGSVQDRNGNQISFNGTTYIDTLGTSVLALGGSHTAASPFTLTYTPPNTSTSRCASTNTAGVACYTVNYTNYTVATNFGLSGTNEFRSAAAVPLVTSIVLPDGTQYSFTYEATPSIPAAGACTPYAGTTCVTARLTSITLPTGGAISYSYSGGNNGILPDGSTATLTRTTPDGVWTYAQVKGTSAASTTTITDPQNNQTVIQFQSIYETQRQIYQGSSSSGTLLQTLIICYNGNLTNCNTTTIILPITRRTLTMQFPGGLQSKTDSFMNGFGLPTEFDEYDYGTGAPGSLLRKTLTTYASLGNGIVAAPSSVTIQDGNGSTKAQMTYSYDQTAVTASSGTPQHVAVSGSRGNVTTASRLVAGTTSLSRTSTYYDTGNIFTFTDTNGAVTTSNFSSGGSCGNSFVTSLTMPLGLSRSMAWNCTGGVVTSLTDENGQTATTTYNDPFFWRPATLTDAQSNSTNLTYTGANVSESVLLFNGGQSTQDVLRTLDGMGRPKLLQSRQAPGSSNFDTYETDYNTLGHPYRKTVPYAGTSGQTNSTAPASVSLYDSLGRITQTTDGGGGILSKAYIQNDVLRVLSPAPTGENTKRKQLEYDALGRLASVCEITGAAGSGNCAQNSPQTGYWTKYSYDVMGNMTGVLQNAQSSGTQSRSFAFDMLGRMTSETNPETGTTSYTFDSASGCSAISNGDLIKKVDAVGNTLCYSYDAFHRVTSITYSGPYAASTPNKYFIYDSATVNSVAMTNAKTRLAEAYTATCSTCTKITDTGYSYDVRGEPSDAYESTSHSGGYYHVNSTYWPNREVNQLGGVPGLPTMTYGVDGEGRGYSVSASSGQNPVQSILYNVFQEPTSATFGSGDSDAFAYDPNSGRITQYQFTVNGQSVVGNLGWNQNRTLSTLTITDPFNSANSQNCSYLFDDLKRLASSNCGPVWSQTFNYDPFGNITMSGTGSFQPTYSSTTNRMVSLPGFTPTYDANGNLLSDSAHTYSWDADGLPASIDSISVTHDALDRMVEQNRGGSYTQIIYAPSGSKLALMNGQTLTKAYVPLPSGATAVYTSAGLSYYRHADWLGSSRLASTSSRTIYSDSAYSPFGQSYAQSGSTDVAFTGQNQDTVPGLYDFPAREYAPFQGRWISPDPSGILSVNPMNPKTWNRYSYSLNNPLSMVDPNGECSQPAGLQPGQIGVCIDLYIASPSIGDFGIVLGLGDNRGPDSNSGPNSFRVEYSVVYDPQQALEGGVGATVTVTTDPSHVMLFEPGANWDILSATGDTTGSVVSTENPDGSVTVSIDTSSLNGFSFVPGSPGAIMTDMSFTMSPDGFTSIDPGSSRSAFPTMEMWTYAVGQDPFNLLYLPETTPAALGSLNQEIPDVSNDPSTASGFTNGADGSDGAGDSGGGGGGGGGFVDEGEDPEDEDLLLPLCDFPVLQGGCTRKSLWALYDVRDWNRVWISYRKDKNVDAGRHL